jgi:hypothetical protein
VTASDDTRVHEPGSAGDQPDGWDADWRLSAWLTILTYHLSYTVIDRLSRLLQITPHRASAACGGRAGTAVVASVAALA